MRVCIERSSGKMIESQSGAAPYGTLVANAVGAGYAEEDVEEKVVTQEEWQQLYDFSQPEPTWQDNRIAAYGSWREQLDMMYHGTWEDHVASVKAANPKE